MAHLSTVSSSLTDFMILTYATHFWQEQDPKYFLNFFIWFEQTFAFVRMHFLEDNSFNGITFVDPNLQEGAVWAGSTSLKKPIFSRSRPLWFRKESTSSGEISSSGCRKNFVSPAGQGQDTIYRLIDFIHYTDHLEEQYYQEQDEDGM